MNANQHLRAEMIGQDLSSGRLIVATGVGKSGIAAQYFVSALRAHGVAATFMDPTDALHGDLGLLGPSTRLVVVSASGQTDELYGLLRHVPGQQFDLAVVGVADDGGSIADMARWRFVTGIGPESDHVTNFVPSASFIAACEALAFIAYEIAKARGITNEDRERVHPGGHLHSLRA